MNEPTEELLERFAAHVRGGRIACRDLDEVRSGLGSHEASLAVHTACSLASDAQLVDDDFWALAEVALDLVNECSDWVWQMRTEADPLPLAGGWVRAWRARDGALWLRAQDGKHGPVALGRDDASRLLAYVERGPAPESTLGWTASVGPNGHLELFVFPQISPPRALVAALRSLLPDVRAEASVDPWAKPPAEPPPPTVERAEEAWAQGRRIEAIRIYRAATGASLSDAKRELEGRGTPK